MIQQKILKVLTRIERGQSKIIAHFEVAESNISVRTAVKQCLAAKKVKLKPVSRNTLRKHFASLCEVIGDKSIKSVTTQDINRWIKSHPDWAAKTQLNNIKSASSLFAWLVRRGDLARNPCAAVERPKVLFKPVTILSVHEIRQLLFAAKEKDPALIGYIALVLFGGLRPTEARECRPEFLHDGKIDLGGEHCKLNDRRLVDISPQLAAWLAVPGVQIGGHKNLENRLKALGVKLAKNVLRHSFCSYNLPLFGEEKTAKMANNSPQKLRDHYLANVSKEQAKEFAEILP